MDECRRKRKGEEKERNVERTGRVIEQRGRKKKGKREREIERPRGGFIAQGHRRNLKCMMTDSHRREEMVSRGERSKGEGIGKRIGEERTKRERWKERG
jgi:hypothetical protein